MKLTSTAIDKVPNEWEKIIKNLLEFFHTDAVCCRDKDDSPLGGMFIHQNDFSNWTFDLLV